MFVLCVSALYWPFYPAAALIWMRRSVLAVVYGILVAAASFLLR